MDANNSQPGGVLQKPAAPAPPAPPMPGPASETLVPPIVQTPEVTPPTVSTGPVFEPPTNQPKKGLSVLNIALIIMVVVLIIAIGYIAYVKLTAPPAVAPTPLPTVQAEPTVAPTPEVTPQASSSGSPAASTGEIPADLASVVKQNAADQSKPKVTADKVIIGQFQVEGNYAMVAFGYADGGGAVFWLSKTGGIWKVVNTGQEPPKCSLLTSYNFPADFSCNP